MSSTRTANPSVEASRGPAAPPGTWQYIGSFFSARSRGRGTAVAYLGRGLLSGQILPVQGHTRPLPNDDQAP